MSSGGHWVFPRLLYVLTATTNLVPEVPVCDMNQISQETPDWALSNATWFLKMQSTESTFIRPDEASKIIVRLTSNQGQTQASWQETLVRPGSDQCEYLNGTFQRLGPILQHHADPSLFLAVVALAKKLMAMWIQHGIHTALNIYSTTPSGTPDLSTIRSKLVEICGQEAGNASSGVYNRVLSYEGLPACFTESLNMHPV